LCLSPTYIRYNSPNEKMPSSTSILALLGAVASTFAQCVIPIDPPSINNTITEPFQLFVQNISLPIIHDRILNFLPNGADMHLVLRPDGEDTYDTIWLDNGFMRNVDRYAVIDLQVTFPSHSGRNEEQC
jgi:hypothetical protein